jgi:quercetin dioxygenase-like cupin family protein
VLRQFPRATVIFVSVLLIGYRCAFGQRPFLGCLPIERKTSETGCWILGSYPLGSLAAPVYWTIDTFPNKELAEAAKGQHGAVFSSLGKIWLFTVGDRLPAPSSGTRITEIGPLAFQPDRAYTAQFMEATFEPGMAAKIHIHSGIEAFYTDSGEPCLETPAGMQIGKKGRDIVVPEGIPMQLSATGTEARRGLILILHDSSKPATTVVDTWQPKGLCFAK